MLSHAMNTYIKKYVQQGIGTVKVNRTVLLPNLVARLA